MLIKLFPDTFREFKTNHPENVLHTLYMNVSRLTVLE